jgi:hypothetical protein
MEDVRPSLLLVESGGDNLAAQFSRELVDYTIYVIDVSGGDKIRARADPASPSQTCWSSTDRPRNARRRRPRRHGARREADARR